MDDHGLEDIARQLSDLEVALFLCLASREHCLIETTGNCLNDLAKELVLVHFPLPVSLVSCCSYLFGL
jgi:hypothetical protein